MRLWERRRKWERGRLYKGTSGILDALRTLAATKYPQRCQPGCLVKTAEQILRLRFLMGESWGTQRRRVGKGYVSMVERTKRRDTIGEYSRESSLLYRSAAGPVGRRTRATWRGSNRAATYWVEIGCSVRDAAFLWIRIGGVASAIAFHRFLRPCFCRQGPVSRHFVGGDRILL